MAPLTRLKESVEHLHEQLEGADHLGADERASLEQLLGEFHLEGVRKSLGERLLARDRGRVPVAIVRPAIVESAVAAAEATVPGAMGA